MSTEVYLDRIRDVQFHEVSRPLRTLFSTSLGRKTRMRSVVVKVVFDRGGMCDSALGEVPTSFVLKNETIPRIKRVLRSVGPEFIGTAPEDYEAKIGRLRGRFRATPMTISGLETALFRAALKCKGVSEHDFWGGHLRRLETDITIPFIADEESLRKWLDHIVRQGFGTYKLKVSGGVGEDLRLIGFVHRVLEDRLEPFTLRLDGNQGYNRKTFFRLTDGMEKRGYRIQLIEQPLPKDDYGGLKYVKARSAVPIVLDETVFDGADLARVIDQDLADGVNIKVAKSGIAESARMIRLAKRSGLKLMIGCMTETMVGLSSGIFCAAGTGAFDYVDLDAVHFLHHRRTFDGITIEGREFIIG